MSRFERDKVPIFADFSARQPFDVLCHEIWRARGRLRSLGAEFRPKMGLGQRIPMSTALAGVTWVPCRYCGLDAGVFVNHASVIDCLEALRHESSRLQKRVETVTMAR